MSFTICIRNQLDEIEKAQTELTQWLEGCGCQGEKIDEMCLITEELLVNTISHGFEPGIVSELKVVCSHTDAEYCLEFHDHGKTFNPTEAEERPEGKVGGWGIPLVVALSDHLEYCPGPHANVLRVQILKRDNEL